MKTELHVEATVPLVINTTVLPGGKTLGDKYLGYETNPFPEAVPDVDNDEFQCEACGHVSDVENSQSTPDGVLLCEDCMAEHVKSSTKDALNEAVPLIKKLAEALSKYVSPTDFVHAGGLVEAEHWMANYAPDDELNLAPPAMPTDMWEENGQKHMALFDPKKFMTHPKEQLDHYRHIEDVCYVIVTGKQIGRAHV